MHPELKWFLILLGFLWLGWFVTGGPNRVMVNRENPFIEEVYDGGEIYGPDDLRPISR
jgi:hypothetical protein